MYSIRISFLAAAMMHVEGAYSTISLPHRNNNPGNLRKWGNMPIVNGYAKFPRLIDGYHALLNDIWINRTMTIGAFLSKFAPKSENDLKMYISEVCTITGFNEGDIIDVA